MPHLARAPRAQAALSALIGVGLCLAFLALRYHYRPPLGDGLDGAYYFQIARQVALGHGLDTSYSVFHMALAPLPQRATTYPLLPLCIGYLGRIVPLSEAAVWLPGAAYVLSIGLCYGFLLWVTARSQPRSPWTHRVLLCAALSAWFGLLPVYVWTSARPYTETLSNALVLGTLWCFGLGTTARFRAAWQRRAAFVAVGLLAGLCYLARFQLIVVPIALLLARMLARDRRALRDSAWLTLGAAACLAWQAWRQLTLPNGQPYALIDFAMYRQRADVPPFVYDMQFGNRWAWFLDKLRGVLVSLDPNGIDSYLVQLSFLVLVVPLGVIVLLLRQIQRARGEGWRALGCAGLRRPRHAALLASVWLGVLAVAPLHTVHSLRWRSWAFAWRQGMPLVYLVIPIVIWLLSFDKRALRALVALLLGASLVVCARKTEEVLDRRVPTGQLDAYADVARYLDEHAPTNGTLGMEHQSLAVFTAQPLYWLACWSPPAFAQVLIRDLPIDRIVLRPGELYCPSLDRIRSLLRAEQSFTAHFPFVLYRIERHSTSR
ncbi:MAG: hypothetical protein ABIQ16_17285 [Polyangiaceae bacterium]